MAPYTPENIIQLLKDYRRSHYITQAQLAERLGCSVEAVQSWEQGRVRPSQMARNAIQLLFEFPLPFAKPAPLRAEQNSTEPLDGEHVENGTTGLEGRSKEKGGQK